MSSSNSTSPISLLSFVDGLWDSAKVAKIIYFTLCFDVLYFWLKGNGLFGIKLGKEFDLSLADLAGMVIALGIFSSIILKIISLFFLLVLINIKYSKPFQKKEKTNYQKSYTEVFTGELREDALGVGDDLSFKIYTEEKRKRNDIEKEQRNAEIISFGVFLVFFSEWYLSASDGSSKMFIDWLWEQLKYRDPTTTHSLVGLIISLILLAYAVMVCWPKDVDRMVYYPKLARKLRKEEDEKEKSFNTW
ncbi:hypothetical protein OI450_05525 [Pectobacterium cacticida]|uniref:Uncharacterized protein n=1 Tax=Pectobacterium cacticida TaxID=69221 RepID=A0ABZ2G7L6_9GAMM|nr:hypothetical protein [Pectobacterium cacticida]UYX07837.1 hypothetical protein OI450_05525 [Pectobacterium cacticida]